MKNLLYLSIFASLFLWSCSSPQVAQIPTEVQTPKVEVIENVTDTKKENFLSLEDLLFKVKESHKEINQLDQQLDALLKDI